MYFRFLGRSFKKHDAIVGAVFVLPAFVLGCIFVVAPMLVSLAYSVTDANLLALNNVHFNGFVNFAEAFGDTYLWNAFLNTLEFVVKVVPLQLCASLGLALILNTKIRCNTFFRWAFFCPVMLSLAVTSFLWMNLLNEQEGLINAILENLGFSRQPFLESPKQAMNVIVFISAWQGAGYQMLIFLSGLKNIPPEITRRRRSTGQTRCRNFSSSPFPTFCPPFRLFSSPCSSGRSV